ncbi:MAG: radical SAM protein [Sedimentisphaerales bacterium]|nr:radical SAM protein [Sedimentisphaerales bacterium]
MENKSNEQSYIYGPVPSRRLGLSLGVDIIPPKVCTLDCVYCQVGRTTRKTAERGDFLDIEIVLAELREKLAAGVKANYVTVGGSGEPTLHSRLGDLIDGIRTLTDIPVALLTNGTLLYRADVRGDCARADVVLPSLDAGDAEVFAAVNRPIADISIEKLVSGMVQFREEFSGQIWLEVFLIPGVNTDRGQIEKIKSLVERIRPDRVHVNTAVRPVAEKGVEAVPPEQLAEIARRMGASCEVVAGGPGPPSCDDRVEHATADVLSMLKRRPCSIPDICAGLGMTRNEAVKHVSLLQEAGVVIAERRGGQAYFCATGEAR